MLKIPETIIELQELEARWVNAIIFTQQSDNYSECEKAYEFIREAEEAFSKCKVKFTYG